jgi:Flp pilus assembly protein TadG
MNRFGIPLLRRFLKSEQGQTAVIVMVTAGTMMSLAGASIESGHVYYAYQQLVASTNAAAMAGAQAMPNTTQASTNVTLYSSQSGELNANSMLQNVTATPSFLCLSTVTSSLNVPCSTSTGASGGYNALGDRDGGDAGRNEYAVEYRRHPGHDGVNE